MSKNPTAYVTVYPSGSVQIECFASRTGNKVEEINAPDWKSAIGGISLLVSYGWDIAVSYFKR